MFEQIASLDGGHFSEVQCTQVMVQVAQAVKYVHTMGVAHRDLKPENILCVRPNSIKEIKIADFGISKILWDHETERKKQKKSKTSAKSGKKDKYKKPNSTMSTMCGTISYAAPEILQQSTYKKSCDFFSIGVIMFILLCGYPPFTGETELEVIYTVAVFYFYFLFVVSFCVMFQKKIKLRKIASKKDTSQTHTHTQICAQIL